MYELAFANTHADRRHHTRRQVLRPAELILRNDPASQICVVLDESDGGVQVETDGADVLPEEAVIKFSDNASQLVRRCWASGNRAGYQFVEMVAVQRHWLQDDQQRPQPVDILALNNFVAMSRTLLNLFVENPACLHSIEQICARLAEVPHDHARIPDARTANEQSLDLLKIPQATSWRPVDEQV
jgi:hypothetical protein